MDVLSISLRYLCARVYLIHALQLVCRWGVIAENALSFHMRSISTAESISIFLIPPSLRFVPHPSADSSALQCPGDPYLPPELQSAQKLVMEVGKEAGWLTLQLLETKQ